MTARARIDSQRYADLLATVLPKVIETEEENERMLKVVEHLLEKGDERTPEEKALTRLLVLLIEAFEEEHYELSAATPAEVLKHLMQARELQPSDLWDLFGSKGLTSDVLSGKREISKGKARLLGEFFHVPYTLFL